MANLTSTSNKTKKDIRYLGKDFNDFKQNLVNFTQTYFRQTFNNYSESGIGSMFLEISSYVGDVLSFYLDTQMKEMILMYAEEQKNVLQLAQSLGYKPRITSPSTTNIEVFQLVPSIGSGDSVRPDYNYALIINEGMIVTSTEDSTVNFKTTEEIDFNFSSSFNPTTVSIYSTNASDEPDYYLLKKTVNVQSGTQKIKNFTLSEPEKYKELTLTETNVISIDNVIDSDNNIWYEVDYLAQDTIFKRIQNTQTNDPSLVQYNNETPYLLKNINVPKRFIKKYNNDFSINLQFGSGVVSDSDEVITPNPDNVGLTIPTGVNKLNLNWDISNFIYTTAYGEAPHNTTLTVTYTIGGGLETNVIPNVIRNIKEVVYNNDREGLDTTILNLVKGSLAVNNPEAATGGKSSYSVDEIRQNALAYFSAQRRTVTMEDYIMRAYNMPQEFGSIAKAYIVQDEQISLLNRQQQISNPLTLNLYILTYDANKRLMNANVAIKQNLKTYLDRYRMITDAINIKNAFIVNIQVNYVITVLPDYSSKSVLLYCTNELKDFFDIDKWQINQPIIIADIIRALANVKGVQSIIGVEIYNLFGSDDGYSDNVYDIQSATKKGVIYPAKDPMIFELKKPNSDLLGRISQY